MIDWTNAGNMADLMEMIRQEAGDRVIMKYMNGREAVSMTGVEFFSYADRCAGYLALQGSAGKHIGIMGANRWQWMAWLCGIFRVGAVAVLLSPDLNPDELRERTRQTDIDMIVCDKSLLTTVQDAAVEACSMDDIPEVSESAANVNVLAEDLACILFTSGTTARCRAASFTHRDKRIYS